MVADPRRAVKADAADAAHFYYFVDVRSSVLYRVTLGRAHEVVRDKTGGGNGTTFDLQGRPKGRTRGVVLLR